MSNSCDPQSIKNQIRRTEGQVLSFGKMFDAGRSCSDLLQQIVAARASLQKLGTMLLEAEAQGCFTDQATEFTKVKNLELIMSNLFKIT